MLLRRKEPIVELAKYLELSGSGFERAQIYLVRLRYCKKYGPTRILIATAGAAAILSEEWPKCYGHNGPEDIQNVSPADLRACRQAARRETVRKAVEWAMSSRVYCLLTSVLRLYCHGKDTREKAAHLIEHLLEEHFPEYRI